MNRKVSLLVNGLGWEVWVIGEEFRHGPIDLGQGMCKGEWRNGLPLHVSARQVFEMAGRFEEKGTVKGSD